MAGLEDVLQRVANDRSFADAVRSDPTNALRGYQLDPSELARLERVLGATPSSEPTLFSAASGASAAGVGITKLALVAAGLGLLGGGAGIALGAAGAFGGGNGNGGGDGSATLRPDAAPFFDCSSDAATGAALGDLHRGDTVWVIGRTDDGWLVIRNPQDLTTPAWMRAGDLEVAGDTGGLPPLTCEQAVTEATAPLPSATTTAPTSTVLGETTTTSVDSTTTAPITSVPATTTPPATTAPATTAPDTTGPAVSASSNSPFVYSEGGAGCAGYLQQVTITVTATDPNGATVQGVTWSAGSLNGTATPLGGNQFRIGPVYSTHNGTITLTVTAQAVDGRGNVGSGQTTVQFRQIADECIG
jgi:hypothetical protein